MNTMKIENKSLWSGCSKGNNYNEAWSFWKGNESNKWL